MGKKLLEKAGLVGIPRAAVEASQQPSAASPATQPPVDSGRPRTAPGAMLQFISKQSSAVQESDALRAKLAEFDGAKAARLLDPKTVGASAWANRHEDSFKDEEFLLLKAEIESAGGNIQPIKVRRRSAEGRGVGPSNPLESKPSTEFEVVFGSRRHRACLELALPVLALIDDVSEQQLFVEMERENRNRKDLSAWEQGKMYARALDQGLYPSNRQLAAAIGRDLGDVGRALLLARLPDSVVGAFGSPLELQFRWAKPLGDVQQRDPDGLLHRAKSMQARSTKPSAKEVFDFLIGVGQGVGPSNPPKSIDVKVSRKVAATVRVDQKGKTVVEFVTSLDQKRREELAVLIENFLTPK